METEFLNFRDEEHFSDFSLSLEQNLVEKPQDLLMHMVENDFDYMETHLDITNSDGLWTNHECMDDVGEVSTLENASISKLDSIKEDFAKVLTDWQEHIGYLQASDMDEYMDIIGFNINTTDKKNFCTSENVFEDELIHTAESNLPMLKEDLGKQSLQISHSILDSENSNNKIEFVAKKNGRADDFIESNNQTADIETESLLKEPKFLKSQNKVKKNVPKCKNIGIDINTTQKKKKKEKQVHYNKDTHNNDGNSDKYLVNQLPVLQAGDVKSLLEQFEASENKLSFYPSCSMNMECDQVYVKSNETQYYMKQSQTFTTKKSLSRISNLHKNIRSVLPKEVVENIKTSAHKKEISIISTIPNAQSNGRSNGTRMQDAAVTLFRNKLLKAVSNDTKNKIINGGLIQLDHDYCSTNCSISNSDSNSEYEIQYSDSENVVSIKDNIQQLFYCYTEYEKQSVSSHLTKNVIKSKECLSENNSKKYSGLESGEISDNSEQSAITVVNGVQINESVKQLQNTIKECEKEISPKQESYKHIDIATNKSNFIVSKVQNKSANTPKHETKIQSALATGILQLQQETLSKTESITTGSQKIKQMVSVLKKPLNVQQLPVLMTTSNESVITTTNSLNDKVQNIIVQTDEKNFIQESSKKPPRKKLNLAEYRSRREQNRSDNSRTNSPVPPMTLVYIHHASTTTEPIKDDVKNLIWSEREIVSLLKPKTDVDEKRVLPKPSTCDIGIQTYETVFEFPQNSLIGIDERERSIRDKNHQPCKKQRISSSSSRSRSRSNSRSKSRSRSRSSSNRSRSYKRNNTRHRRISHRRSSVSSSSSWSSRSRSNTRSSLSSESRYSRSRSRLSRSRSRSSSRYSSCSRSSSRSNFARNRWSRRKRRQSKKYHRNYDRDSQHSKSHYRDYEDWRRSSSNSYRRPYDNWYDREKQRQVEERRVIYVGRLDEGITKADLRRRFEIFGPVVDISVHFREHGDNYGFVTFAYKNDAYEAVEHGNDNPTLPRYDLCFGGRRAFCKVKYADLDGIANDSFSSELQSNEDNTFDLLLKEAKAKLRKRKV